MGNAFEQTGSVKDGQAQKFSDSLSGAGQRFHGEIDMRNHGNKLAGGSSESHAAASNHLPALEIHGGGEVGKGKGEAASSAPKEKSAGSFAQSRVGGDAQSAPKLSLPPGRSGESAPPAPHAPREQDAPPRSNAIRV